MGRIVGYHGYVKKNGEGFLTNNEGDVRSEPPFLDWLMEDHAGDEFKKVCYDLDAFVAIVCRLAELSEEEGRRLLEKEKLRIPPYDLTYFPSKYFAIGKGSGYGRPYAGFYNMEQYFEGPSLENNPSPAYAILKAVEARGMGAKVSKTFYELGWDGNTLTSPVRSLEKSAMKGMNVPTHKDIPPEVNDLALRCCRGVWVEAYQLGRWEKAYDYDLRSAYPFFLSELYDLRRGDWVLSPERPEGAVYGFQEGVVSIDAPFSPVLFVGQEDERSEYTYSPNGEWPDCLGADTVDMVRNYRLGSFDPQVGRWWIPKGGVQYQPMKGIVNWLYQKRQGKSGLELKVLKRAMASLWGKTLAMYGGEYADTFNPVWGELVEERDRLEVAKFVLDNKMKPFHVAVDGVLADKKVKLPEDGGMGTWRMSHVGGAIVASSGVAAVEGKEGAEDFSLKYDWFRERLEADPEASEYAMRKWSVVTLAKALNTDFFKLGELEEITKTVSVGVDGKRLYYDQPMNGGDLLNNRYESEPLDVSMIMVKEA